RKLLARPRYELIADRGWVNCPFAQGDIEVDACMSCPRVMAVDVDSSGNGTVRCRAAGMTPWQLTAADVSAASLWGTTDHGGPAQHP
ncbi:MAG TPA: hypothetical protein VFO98_00590, partial [Marmoricola sp.]|nr:hypothetical protein [Marmoricola sp.]